MIKSQNSDKKVIMTIESKLTKPMIRVVLADDHAVERAGIRQFLEKPVIFR